MMTFSMKSQAKCIPSLCGKYCSSRIKSVNAIKEEEVMKTIITIYVKVSFRQKGHFQTLLNTTKKHTHTAKE